MDSSGTLSQDFHQDDTRDLGIQMHELATRLFPIGRSLTGNGVRDTLKILREYIPLTIHEVPTGMPAFDWTVPKEWNIREAYIEAPDGRRFAEYAKHTLHVVGYSTPVDAVMPLEEMEKHLYSLPEQPNAIPYVTSYYKERWGFCLTHNERKVLLPGNYRVRIDSELKDGSLTYGELRIPGRSKKEIFLSTYVCHPSMGNNELSGPVVTTFLARMIMRLPRKYSYRIVFVPETLGSLVYLSKHVREMKKNIIAGYMVTCVGDERGWSYLPSRQGNTLSDRVALQVLRARHPDFKRYSFADRESDERQYCSPGADLPMCSIMRSKYNAYPEYHTSLDDLSFITPNGLKGSYDVLRECIEGIEGNEIYRTVYVGEPQLGKRGLYPTLSERNNATEALQCLLDVLAYADGSTDLVSIAEATGRCVSDLCSAAKTLSDVQLIRVERSGPLSFLKQD